MVPVCRHNGRCTYTSASAGRISLAPPPVEIVFNQTWPFDPAEGDPGPDFDFDQSLPGDLYD